MQVVRVVIVGSGSSSSTPSLHCALSSTPCATCTDALHNHDSPNHRLNPSLLIQLRRRQRDGGDDAEVHHVLIDCGKTLREAALKVFPRFGVRDLSAVLLTHEHADACFGLDDLRELVRPDTPNGLDVYADAATTQAMQRRFDYLLHRSESNGRVVDRRCYRAHNTTWIATLDWHIMQPMTVTTLRLHPRRSAATDSVAKHNSNNSSSSSSSSNTTAAAAAAAAAMHHRTTATRNDAVDDMDDEDRADAHRLPWRFVAIPVLHGPGYYCNAFLFRLDDGDDDDDDGVTVPRLLLYASDMSEADDAFFANVARAKALLCGAVSDGEGGGGGGAAADVQLEVLILDMLSHTSYISHLSVSASLALARTLNARHTYFVGMSHSLEHGALSDYLQQQGVAEHMHVSYDGCVVAQVDGGVTHATVDDGVDVARQLPCTHTQR